MFWKSIAYHSALVLTLTGGVAPALAGPADIETTIRSLAEELAQAISNRDAVAAARRVRAEGHVVYVSDGTPIRGTEYRETLERFYAGLNQLSLKWERTEVRKFGSMAGVFTGWATINSTDNAGTIRNVRAVFTLVYADTGSGWELVVAHKTTLP